MINVMLHNNKFYVTCTCPYLSLFFRFKLSQIYSVDSILTLTALRSMIFQSERNYICVLINVALSSTQCDRI